MTMQHSVSARCLQQAPGLNRRRERASQRVLRLQEGGYVRHAEHDPSAPPRVLFLYWGRRGLSEFVLQLATAAGASADLHAVFSVSRQNDRFQDFIRLGACIEPVECFRSNVGALAVWRVRRLRAQILARIRRERIDTVISLMPHVWGSLVSPAIRAQGSKFVSIVHDAAPHPGDAESLVASWTFRDIPQNSDLVLTLSEHVTRSLAASGLVDPCRVRTLFHPELCLSAVRSPTLPSAGGPFRVLFLGRILPYKGLGLLITAVESLRRSGLAIELGVFGDGALGSNAKRLEAMGAEVVNRWLSAEEISAVLGRYHALVLSHTEASQSGIAALAAGHCVPVVASPVGGLVEQVRDERDGVLARSADAGGLAEAIAKLAHDSKLYCTISAALAADREQRSMNAFLAGVLTCVKQLRQSPSVFATAGR
jgi:glycosyltransferase involved in cell wall biosynthesis